MLVHGDGDDSLYAITRNGPALFSSSRHPRSLHSHAFFIAIALSILIPPLSLSALLSFPQTFSILSLWLSSVSLIGHTIQTALQPILVSVAMAHCNRSPKIQSADIGLFRIRKIRQINSHFSDNQIVGLLIHNASTPAPSIIIRPGLGGVIYYPYRHHYRNRHPHRHCHHYRPTRWVLSKLEASWLMENATEDPISSGRFGNE